MATIALSLSSKVDANGKSQVRVRLTITRTNRPRFKSGVYVRPEWMHDGVLTIPKRGKLNFLEIKEAEEAKAQLDDYVSRLTHISNQLNKDADKKSIEDALEVTKNVPTGQITLASILEAKKSAKKQQEAGGSFFDMMNTYLKEKHYGDGLERGYRVLMRTMARYEGFVRQTDNERKSFAWDIDKTSQTDIEDFLDYTRNERELSEQYPTIYEGLLTNYPVEVTPKHPHKSIEERGENTVINMAKRCRAFFRWLNEKGYTNNEPFKGVEIKGDSYGRPWYLTLEERNTIAEYDLSDSPKLAVQRDIFIFQCLIGCRVSDLLSMTNDCIINGAVEYIPKKTQDTKPVVVRVPLNNRALDLVERYKGVDKKGRLFPFISSQNYNDAIKEILTKCKITRKVTIRNSVTGKQEQKAINCIASSHMARRTFIGNLYKQVKDPSLIGVLSGHAEGSRAFARYRDIDDEMKKEVVSLID